MFGYHCYCFQCSTACQSSALSLYLRHYVPVFASDYADAGMIAAGAGLLSVRIAVLAS